MRRLLRKAEAQTEVKLFNCSSLHNRDAFDWGDPKRKRLLLRMWINIPNARDLTWEFADHYNTGPSAGDYRLFDRRPGLPCTAFADSVTVPF